MIGHKNTIFGGSIILQQTRIPEKTRNGIILMNLIGISLLPNTYCRPIRTHNILSYNLICYMLHKLKRACFIRKKTTLNKCVFKCFAKVAGLLDGRCMVVRSLNSTGKSFQQLGPATAKALKPQSVLWLGTTDPYEQQILKSTDQRLPNPWCKKQQGKPERDLQDT